MELLLDHARVVPGLDATGRPSTAAHPGSLLVREGRVVSVGPAGRPAPGAVRIDLRGRLVTPAFVDAHVHLAETGQQAMAVDLTGATSAADLLALVAGHAEHAELSGRPGVVLGHGWDESAWEAGTVVTREDLDRATRGRAAYLSRVDMHSALVSTALVEAAGGESRMSALPGWSARGPVAQDAHHAVRDAARSLVTAEDRAEAVSTALAAAAAAGVGQVHEMGAPHLSTPDDFATVAALAERARSEGRAVPDVVGYWGDRDTAVALRLGLVGAAGDLCVDGAIGSRTAALREDYADAPGVRGALYLDADDVAGHLVACTRAGLQGGFHVIGDRGAGAVLDGLRAAEEVVGLPALRAARHRLEHLEMVDAEQLDALARWGVVLSVQPRFDALWGGPGGLYAARVGERAPAMNPFSTALAAGAVLALGSDTPVTPFDPWGGLRAAVHHRTPGSGLTPAQALHAHTVGGWVAGLQGGAADLPEALGGTLLPGAPATLAAWDTEDDLEALCDPGAEAPRCTLSLVDGLAAHDPGGLVPPRRAGR
ncbi:amidohydrolase [Nocardioides marmoribigeumensis]|uniref:Amidohydrolase YtcJ n=1 Tax=Nocardioides marmoribigeumensis TaxID=433649 RepID=A0ABU2C111_9ACTN|nr:amidohydrolase family protein [Nocardioides marmoribigeumensis]MDR7364372.1 putative amidohydrolase YtcJ [Nocardioides marmoribigeumensis]